jgi:hypothetical protein
MRKEKTYDGEGTQDCWDKNPTRKWPLNKDTKEMMEKDMQISGEEYFKHREEVKQKP